MHMLTMVCSRQLAAAAVLLASKALSVRLAATAQFVRLAAKATSFHLATQTLPSVLQSQSHAFASWPQLPPSNDSRLKPSSIRIAANATLLSLRSQLADVDSSVHLAAEAQAWPPPSNSRLQPHPFIIIWCFLQPHPSM